MRRLLIVLVLLAGCGGDDEVDAPVDERAACQAEWDERVDEWNALTIERDEAGEPDVVVDGVVYASWEEYAEAKGWPLTYSEMCEE